MSTWKPTEGLTKAEMLVQILEVEARAAGSVITPVFRHRLVEMIAKTLDGGVVGVLTVSKEQVHEWVNRAGVERAVNGHDDESVHAMKDDVEFSTGLPPRSAPKSAVQPKKAKAVKPEKAGKKRGRPSKAEMEARKAAQA